MPYRPPSLEFYQNLIDETGPAERPLYAVIVGPNFALHRFSEESEKAKIGTYDEAAPGSVDYAWPDHEAGAVVDLNSAKVVLDATQLRYLTGVANANLDADNSNKVVADFVVKTNVAGSRDASLGTRDVQVGDIVKLTWNGGADSFETVVAGFLPDVVPGTIDPVNAFAVNFGSTTAGVTENSTPPTAYTTSYDNASYDGLADGYPLDTYTIVVDTTAVGGVGGLDGTKLQITSEGGDSPAVNPVEITGGMWDGINGWYAIPLGTRGAELRITPAVGTVNVGDRWSVSISQDYTEISPTTSTEFDTIGPYTGDKDTQYILTVTQGGTGGTDTLKFNYQTNNNADIAGSITVPPEDLSGGSNDYQLGTKGMDLRIYNLTEFCTGDQIVFTVLAPTEGQIKTLICRDSVPTLAATDLSMSLLDEVTVELKEPYVEFSQDFVTIYPLGMVESDILGSDAFYPVYGGMIYADYREQKTVGTNVIGTIDSGDGTSELGPAVQENPLALGVSLARGGAEGTPVMYVAIESDDLAGYQAAFEIMTETRDPYSIVVMTSDETIKDELFDHVKELSDPVNSNWRIGWVSNDTSDIQLVSETLGNGDPLVATIEEFGAGEYTKVVATGALFQTQGVEPGDKLRINYSFDLEGNETYNEYTIDQVVDEETLILLTSHTNAIVVPVQAEIWRTLTKTEYSAALAAYPAKYNHRRIRSIYVDGLEEADGTALPLYYACCVLAGQRSNVAPHQSLTRNSVPGIYINPVRKFSKSQNDAIAAGGNWIITKDLSGLIHTRHQLTSFTDPDSIIEREDTITTNLDNISRGFYDAMEPLYGRGNASEETLETYRFEVYVYHESVAGRQYPAILGSQISDYEIASMKINDTHKDTVDIRMRYTLPPPMNSMIVYQDVTIG